MSTTEQHPETQPVEEKKTPTIEEVSDLHEMDPATLSFRREGIVLQLRRDGEEEWQEVSLARLFPLSELERWIAVLDKDGKELGILKDLHGLARESLACVQDDLYKRYLVPQIKRILTCKDRYGITDWLVETDRGEMSFQMRNPHENIQTLLPGRIALIDVEGNRYDIPDLSALDTVSQQWIEQRL